MFKAKLRRNKTMSEKTLLHGPSCSDARATTKTRLPPGGCWPYCRQSAWVRWQVRAVEVMVMVLKKARPGRGGRKESYTTCKAIGWVPSPVFLVNLIYRAQSAEWINGVLVRTEHCRRRGEGKAKRTKRLNRGLGAVLHGQPSVRVETVTSVLTMALAGDMQWHPRAEELDFMLTYL